MPNNFQVRKLPKANNQEVYKNGNSFAGVAEHFLVRESLHCPEKLAHAQMQQCIDVSDLLERQDQGADQQSEKQHSAPEVFGKNFHRSSSVTKFGSFVNTQI